MCKGYWINILKTVKTDSALNKRWSSVYLFTMTCWILYYRDYYSKHKAWVRKTLKGMSKVTWIGGERDSLCVTDVSGSDGKQICNVILKIQTKIFKKNSFEKVNIHKNITYLLIHHLACHLGCSGNAGNSYWKNERSLAL